MNVYEFISKFINIDLKIIHAPYGQKCELLYDKNSTEFLETHSRLDKICTARTFNAYIENSKLIIVLMYNLEVIENEKDL